jgi:hypothetical protein
LEVLRPLKTRHQSYTTTTKLRLSTSDATE